MWRVPQTRQQGRQADPVFVMGPLCREAGPPSVCCCRLEAASLTGEQSGAVHLHPFEHGGDALTQADAHGGDSQGDVLLFHQVDQGGGDAGTGAAERVT